MAYWLLKTEPNEWSWEDQQKKGTEPWTGVRNYQARNFLQQMQIGDQAFFYHTGKERRIMGKVKVVRTAYLDPTDTKGSFVCVDIKAVKALLHPVSLQDIKKDTRLADMMLLKQWRLSVMPIKGREWEIICSYGEGRGAL